MRYSLLIAVWWMRRALAVIGALALTWWIVGDDSWFDSPLPERSTVFLIAVGLAIAVLVCTGVLKIASAGLPREQRERLESETVFGGNENADL